MIKVDLITGFLGSGKTTFIKQYAKHFISQGQKVGILENDYGAVNVDMLLLNELRGENCELEMVAGACDSDCHKRRFKTKLISMAMMGYKRVIVEPSGVFDVDEFFDTLRESPLDNWYEIGSVITVVDSRLDAELSEDSDFFLASQVANAGVIVLSKTQLTDSLQIENTKMHIKNACEKAKLTKKLDNIFFEKDWSTLTTDDFDKLSRASYTGGSYIKKLDGHNNNFSTVYFLELPMTREKLTTKINTLFNDSSFGTIIRIKGFFMEDGIWYQVNATRLDIELTTMPVGQEVFIVIGENIDKDKIDSFMRN